MAFSLFKFNWRKSPAHLLFLSEFISPNEKQTLIKSDSWKSVLKKNPEKVINRFLEEGMIEKADLSGMLNYKYKVTELKAKLKKLGLKVSGKKEELINRIITADGENIKREMQKLNIYQCTEQGKIIAEQYQAKEREKRARFEERTYNDLQKSNYYDASQQVAKFESEKVFPSYILKNYDLKRNAKMLQIMFNNKPKILKNVNDDQLRILRLAAGMMFLWKYNNALKWLPSDFELDLLMDKNSAANMIISYALHKEDIEQHRANKIKKIEISTLVDACDECKKLAKKKYRINQVPELPYEKCTSKRGCFCTSMGLYF